MSGPAPLRVGWCPGALRPMAAGDGLIVRVKPRGGALALAQAGALARLAARFGNGVVTLTARANLQIRGAAPEGVDALAGELARLGLLDPSAQAEAVRNVTASPLAGRDPAALLDARTVTAALEDRLVRDPALWRLPPKFAWTVDDGGSLPLDDATADVRFGAERRDGAASFAIRLAGGPGRAARCEPSEVAAAAAALAGAFLDLCAAEGLAPHRMRDLLAVRPATAVFDRAGLPHGPDGDPLSDARRPTVGLFPSGARSWVGTAPPFGWTDARALATLAHRAGAAGAVELRLTPWRTILVPGLGEAAARSLHAALHPAASSDPAFIVDPDDPRLAVTACSGAPACRRASTPVRSDAARLAALLGPDRPPGTALHVSGCAKGCAHPGAAPVTLVGRDGAYDLVRRGTAADPPFRRALSADAVAAMLRSPQPEPAC